MRPIPPVVKKVPVPVVRLCRSLRVSCRHTQGVTAAVVKCRRREVRAVVTVEIPGVSIALTVHMTIGPFDGSDDTYHSGRVGLADRVPRSICVWLQGVPDFRVY